MMWKYPHSLNSWVSSCGWKPSFQLWTRLTAPATKKQIQMLQLLCPTGMYSYNHRCRLSSLTRTQTAEPGITRLLANPMKPVLGYTVMEHVSWHQVTQLLLDYTGICVTRCFPFMQKNILKSLFGTCVDISNIRGSRINPSLLCLCIVQHTDQHSGPQGSGAHGEFRAQALFWCFVWALFKREGILVFSVTDRPLCLRKHN